MGVRVALLLLALVGAAAAADVAQGSRALRSMRGGKPPATLDSKIDGIAKDIELEASDEKREAAEDQAVIDGKPAAPDAKDAKAAGEIAKPKPGSLTTGSSGGADTLRSESQAVVDAKAAAAAVGAADAQKALRLKNEKAAAEAAQLRKDAKTREADRQARGKAQAELHNTLTALSATFKTAFDTVEEAELEKERSIKERKHRALQAKRKEEATKRCVDLKVEGSLVAWATKDGDSCANYKRNNWCTEAGEPGKGWHAWYGKFQDWAHNGYDASQACCACGGGKGWMPEALAKKKKAAAYAKAAAETAAKTATGGFNAYATGATGGETGGTGGPTGGSGTGGAGTGPEAEEIYPEGVRFGVTIGMENPTDARVATLADGLHRSVAISLKRAYGDVHVKRMAIAVDDVDEPAAPKKVIVVANTPANAEATTTETTAAPRFRAEQRPKAVKFVPVVFAVTVKASEGVEKDAETIVDLVVKMVADPKSYASMVAEIRDSVSGVGAIHASKPRHVKAGATGMGGSETGGASTPSNSGIGPTAARDEDLDHLSPSATLVGYTKDSTGTYHQTAVEPAGPTGIAGATGATGVVGAASTATVSGGGGRVNQSTEEVAAVEADPEVQALESKLAAAKKKKAKNFESLGKKTLEAVTPVAAAAAAAKEAAPTTAQATEKVEEKKMTDEFKKEDEKLEKLAQEQIGLVKAQGGDTKALEAAAKQALASNKEEEAKDVKGLKKEVESGEPLILGQKAL